MDQEVEYVARALYEAEDDALIWEAEPEILKEEFRRYARAAIAMLPRQERDASKVQKQAFPYAA
jgi:mRNA deadenylase 3'-5' endonuclease subunit Ccr4